MNCLVTNLVQNKQGEQMKFHYLLKKEYSHESEISTSWDSLMNITNITQNLSQPKNNINFIIQTIIQIHIYSYKYTHQNCCKNHPLIPKILLYSNPP